MCCMYTVYSGMQEWVIQIPSIPILVSVLFPSLHLKYFRIKFLLLVIIGYFKSILIPQYSNSASCRQSEAASYVHFMDFLDDVGGEVLSIMFIYDLCNLIDGCAFES